MTRTKTPKRGSARSISAKSRLPKTVQYTVRGIPAPLDRALRALAKKEKKSLNQVAMEALQKAITPGAAKRHSDLDEFIGTWVEDPEFDKAIAEQDQIDEEMWR